MSRHEKAAGVTAFLHAVGPVSEASAPTHVETRRRLARATHVRFVEPVTAPTATSPTGYWGKHRRPDPTIPVSP